MLAITLTGLCVSALARHLPSAGGYYSFVSNGLGERIGFFAAWAYFLYDPLIPTLVILISAGILDQVFKANLGWTVPWWAITLVLLAIVHFITYWGVKPSTRLNLLLGVIEMVIMVALALSIIIHSGSQGLSLVPFQFPDISQGWQNVFLGLAFGVLLFTGFESAAPLAEETANPRKAIPRTVVLSIIVVGLLWVLDGYAMIVGWGTANAAGIATASENPFFSLARQVWGWGWIIVVFALVNSSLASALAGQNAGARVLFALGRARILPMAFGSVHRKHQTPWVALTFQTLLNVVVSLSLGFWLGPIGAFGFIGLLITLGLIVVYALGNIAVIPLYWKRVRQEWSLIRHVVVPIAGTLILAFCFYYSIWPLPTWPLSLSVWLVVFWLIIGAILAGYLWRTRRKALQEAATVLFDDGQKNEVDSL
jgi:amino acid transporter